MLLSSGLDYFCTGGIKVDSFRIREVNLGLHAVLVAVDLPNLFVLGQSSGDVLHNERQLIEGNRPLLSGGNGAAEAGQKVGE